MGEQSELLLVQRFKGKVLFNVQMSEYTSIGVGGPADVMVFPKDESDLRDVIGFAMAKNFPLYVIGAGTNILVRDRGIRGVALNMREAFRDDITWQDDAAAIAGSGVRLGDLLSGCKTKSLGGLEFACGIPATVGGAVVMNAGAYGREMKDVVEGVEVLTFKLKRFFLSKSDLRFSYRSCQIPRDSIVMRVHMRFEKKDPSEIEKNIEDCRKKRVLTSQIKHPNAGSIFKNPEGHAAGKLIEEAGLKGHRINDAAISEVHANYIVNLGSAKARDVLSLMALMRDSVYKTTGIVLEPEIKVIGEE